jgi:hypothetical protein
MTSMKILATAVGVTLLVALLGLQSSVAQPGSGFENRGERYSEGDYYRQTRRNPTSVSATRQQALQTCVARAQRQAPGDTHEGQRQRGGIYLSCMHSMGQRP